MVRSRRPQPSVSRASLACSMAAASSLPRVSATASGCSRHCVASSRRARRSSSSQWRSACCTRQAADRYSDWSSPALASPSVRATARALTWSCTAFSTASASSVSTWRTGAVQPSMAGVASTCSASRLSTKQASSSASATSSLWCSSCISGRHCGWCSASSRACTTSWSAWRSQALARAARRSAAGASRSSPCASASRRPCARAWQ